MATVAPQQALEDLLFDCVIGKDGLKVAGRKTCRFPAFFQQRCFRCFFFLIVLVHFQAKFSILAVTPEWTKERDETVLESDGGIPTENALRLCLLPRSAQLFIATGQTRRSGPAGSGRRQQKMWLCWMFWPAVQQRGCERDGTWKSPFRENNSTSGGTEEETCTLLCSLGTGSMYIYNLIQHHPNKM